MSKKNEIPEEAGKVNWDKLQNFSQKGGGKKKKKQQLPKDRSFIKAVAKKLSEEEKAMPYPDEFLAEINIMRGEFTSSGIDLNNIDEDDDKFADDEDFDTVDDLLDEDDDFEEDELSDEEEEDK